MNDKVEICAKNIDGIRNDDNPDLADKDFVEQIKKDILGFKRGE